MTEPDATATREQDEIEVLVEEPEAWRRRLTVTVPRDRVGRERRRQLRRMASSLNLPGFRKGKVPVRVVEERFGPLVDRRTVGAAVESAYLAAVENEGLLPIGEPAFGDVDFQPDRPLVFQVEIEVMPSLRLERTGGFRVERPPVSVEDAEVDDVVERLRTESGVWEPVERKPEEGDLVSVRIARLEPEEAAAEAGAAAAAEGEKGRVESKADESPAAKPYRFELGAGYAIPGVEEAIYTLGPGTSDTFNVTFPEDFDDPELAGATRRLRVELVEVKKRRLPPLDDAFASEVGDFDTLDELLEAIREDLLQHKEEEAERAVHDRLLDSIVEANPFEVPDSLKERYLDRVIEAPEGADPEKVRDARRSLAPAAERQIKRQLVLEHLAEREGLEATDEELRARIEELAEKRGMQAPKLRRRLAGEERLEELRRRITIKKVFDWLEPQSTIE